MAIGITGSMVFFLLSPYVYNKIKYWRITPMFDKLGKCTLGIYWTQAFLLECTWHSIGLYVGTETSFIIAPIIALAELVICYQAVCLLRKNRYTRLVFLGEKQ